MTGWCLPGSSASAIPILPLELAEVNKKQRQHMLTTMEAVARHVRIHVIIRQSVFNLRVSNVA